MDDAQIEAKLAKAADRAADKMLGSYASEADYAASNALSELARQLRTMIAAAQEGGE